MNKIIIPSIFVATVLVAGMFAFMPVQKASTVHTGLAVAKNMQSTVRLDGLTGVSAAEPARVVVIDTTNVGTISKGHFAAVLPNADTDTTCAAGESPFAGLKVLVGQAGVSLVEVQAASGTGIVGGATANFAGAVGTEAVCVFHANFTAGAGGVPATVTDIVFTSEVAAALPNTASITASVQLT